MAAQTAFIQKEIASFQIVVFSKTYCPYCTQTKDLLTAKFPDTTLAVHELDRMPDGSALQQALQDLTGQRTVPSVFVNTKHIGGNSETQTAFRSGQLASMLDDSTSK
jgi:glutaredoxin 3